MLVQDRIESRRTMVAYMQRCVSDVGFGRTRRGAHFHPTANLLVRGFADLVSSYWNSDRTDDEALATELETYVKLLKQKYYQPEGYRLLKKFFNAVVRTRRENKRRAKQLITRLKEFLVEVTHRYHTAAEVNVVLNGIVPARADLHRNVQVTRPSLLAIARLYNVPTNVFEVREQA